MSTAPTAKLTVHQAIDAVMAELPNIGKGDKSPELGYAFRGIEQITRHLQPLLAKHGVVIVPTARITEVVAAPAMKDGWQDVYMRVGWTIVGPDGSTLQAETSGIGRDRGDKGANKAQTAAFKYLLMHLFCIADGKDDGDSHNYEQGRSDAVPDLEAQAKLLGWQSYDAQVKTYSGLRDKTTALSESGGPHVGHAHAAIEWVKQQKITRDTLGLAQAHAWLDMISPAESGDREAPAVSDATGSALREGAVPTDEKGDPL